MFEPSAIDLSASLNITEARLEGTHKKGTQCFITNFVRYPSYSSSLKVNRNSHSSSTFSANCYMRENHICLVYTYSLNGREETGH